MYMETQYLYEISFEKDWKETLKNHKSVSSFCGILYLELSKLTFQDVKPIDRDEILDSLQPMLDDLRVMMFDKNTNIGQLSDIMADLYAWADTIYKIDIINRKKILRCNIVM